MNEVSDIVLDYLKSNDFDGLVNPDNECGCGVDDLAPCDSNCMGCNPAIEVDPPSDDYDRYFATKSWTQTKRIKINNI